MFFTNSELRNVSLVSTSPYLGPFLIISASKCSLFDCTFDVLDTSPEGEDGSGVDIAVLGESMTSTISTCKTPCLPRSMHFPISSSSGGENCITELLFSSCFLLNSFWGGFEGMGNWCDPDRSFRDGESAQYFEQQCGTWRYGT